MTRHRGSYEHGWVNSELNMSTDAHVRVVRPVVLPNDFPVGGHPDAHGTIFVIARANTHFLDTDRVAAGHPSPVMHRTVAGMTACAHRDFHAGVVTPVSAAVLVNAAVPVVTTMTPLPPHTAVMPDVGTKLQ